MNETRLLYEFGKTGSCVRYLNTPLVRKERFYTHLRCEAKQAGISEVLGGSDVPCSESVQMVLDKFIVDYVEGGGADAEEMAGALVRDYTSFSDAFCEYVDDLDDVDALTNSAFVLRYCDLANMRRLPQDVAPLLTAFLHAHDEGFREWSAYPSELRGLIFSYFDDWLAVDEGLVERCSGHLPLCDRQVEHAVRSCAVTLAGGDDVLALLNALPYEGFGVVLHDRARELVTARVEGDVDLGSCENVVVFPSASKSREGCVIPPCPER